MQTQDRRQTNLIFINSHEMAYLQDLLAYLEDEASDDDGTPRHIQRAIDCLADVVGRSRSRQ